MTDDRLLLALRPLVREVVLEVLQERAPSTPPAEGYLLTAEAAREAGVRPATVREWVAKHGLPAIRRSGIRGLRIRRSDLVAFLAGEESRGLPPVNLADERARRIAASIRDPGKPA